MTTRVRTAVTSSIAVVVAAGALLGILALGLRFG